MPMLSPPTFAFFVAVVVAACGSNRNPADLQRTGSAADSIPPDPWTSASVMDGSMQSTADAPISTTPEASESASSVDPAPPEDRRAGASIYRVTTDPKRVKDIGPGPTMTMWFMHLAMSDDLDVIDASADDYFQSLVPRMSACHKKHGAGDFSILEPISVSLVVGERGKLRSASAKGGNPALASCIQRVIKTTTFPAYRRVANVTVTYQINFFFVSRL
jgi:hypothetical protein